MTHSPQPFITSLAFDCLTLDAYGYVSVRASGFLFSLRNLYYPPTPHPTQFKAFTDNILWELG